MKNVCPEVSLSNRKQQIDMTDMISKQLALLIKLDISGCNFSDQGTDMITEVLLKTSSLQELSIANANLGSTLAIRILTAFTNIFSLKVLKLNNNNIEDEATSSLVTVINHNHLIKELNISYNKFSPSGIIPVIITLSNANIQILDISGNFKSSGSFEIEDLVSALVECLVLQTLNISDNHLTFSNVLKVTQALKNHSSLKIFNVSNNITSYFLECEFLVDIILSNNHQLTDINICDRNIRPRFNDNCLLYPLNCDETSERFVLQNLYLSQYALVHRHAQTVTADVNTNFIKVNERCPFSSEKIVSYYFDHNGGTVCNEDHDFYIVIPPGAISTEACVEVQATASRFSQCKLPDGYYPISSYFWISACYAFKIPVYLIMGHYAKVRNLEDIENLCVLQACDYDQMNEEELVMNKVTSGVYFDYEISYCVFATDHFCSICLGKNNKYIPEHFVAFLYTNETDEKLCAEICFCPITRDCTEVITVYTYYATCI